MPWFFVYNINNKIELFVFLLPCILRAVYVLWRWRDDIDNDLILFINFCFQAQKLYCFLMCFIFSSFFFPFHLPSHLFLSTSSLLLSFIVIYLFIFCAILLLLLLLLLLCPTRAISSMNHIPPSKREAADCFAINIK